MNRPQKENPVILFDGVCNLCNCAVVFIINRDRSARYKFASLQSETAKKIISEFSISPDTIDSIILVENGKYYIKSTAAIKIGMKLGALWPLVYIFMWIPRAIGDYLYDVIARNRYRWFGKKQQCMIPSKEIENRFLV